MRKRPSSVVVLDEIEKAHREVLMLLLQVLEEGRLTDGKGRHIDFSNTVVVLTTNLGSEAFGPKGRMMGFGAKNEAVTSDTDAACAMARKALPPELWNRIDERCPFRPLKEVEVARIASLLLAESSKRLVNEKGIEYVADEALVTHLLQSGGFDPLLGARPMRQAVQRLVMGSAPRRAHPSRASLVRATGCESGCTLARCRLHARQTVGGLQRMPPARPSHRKKQPSIRWWRAGQWTGRPGPRGHRWFRTPGRSARAWAQGGGLGGVGVPPLGTPSVRRAAEAGLVLADHDALASRPDVRSGGARQRGLARVAVSIKDDLDRKADPSCTAPGRSTWAASAWTRRSSSMPAACSTRSARSRISAITWPITRVALGWYREAGAPPVEGHGDGACVASLRGPGDWQGGHYHAGAVMSAGLMVALGSAAVAALAEAGVDEAHRRWRRCSRSWPSALAGNAIEARGLVRGLTGPVVRGDVAVVQALHLDRAARGPLGHLPRAVAALTQLVREALPAETRHALDRLLHSLARPDPRCGRSRPRPASSSHTASVPM